jgi:hypothetical protein
MPDAQVVIELDEYEIVIEEQLSVEVIEETTIAVNEEVGVELLEISEPGMTGGIGPQGPAGTPRIEIPFAFGDATPLELFVAEAGKLIERITIFVRAVFDGSNPSLTIGDEGDPVSLMSATENNPSEVAAYQVTPNLHYVSDTQVLLFITPGLGASQGSGLVVVEMQT